MIKTFAVPIASAARTASGSTDIGHTPAEADDLHLFVNVTAVTGTTPTLLITYQASIDGTTWFDRSSTTSITAAGKQVLSLASGGLGKYGRIAWTVGGTTPNFTFSVAPEARKQT